MERVHRITKYFRQSLIDATRLAPADREILPFVSRSSRNAKSNYYLQMDRDSWRTGVLTEGAAQRIRKRGHAGDRRDPEVVVLPRIDVRRVEGGEPNRLKRRILVPLVVIATVDRRGHLVPSGKAPWIPREWLSPVHSADAPLGESSNVDEFLSQNPPEAIKTWQDLVDHSIRMLSAAVGKPIDLSEDAGGAPDLHDLDIHPDYEPTQECLIQLEAPVNGAHVGLVSVLEALAERSGKKLPQLYERFCADSDAALHASPSLEFKLTCARKHVGQMSGEFPLSPKQRNALHYAMAQESGQILAINGPPGTGKTTLLRSVVAQLWTTAAIDEQRPPLIVATSNKNQAITNILDSFAKIDELGLDASLRGRWLPDLTSYGLYCCSNRLANDRNPYLYHSPDDTGCMAEWQTPDHLDRATKFFLEKASRWSGSRIDSVVAARDALHKALKSTQAAMLDGLKLQEDAQSLEEEISRDYGDPNNPIRLKALVAANVNASATRLSKCEDRDSAMQVLWESRSFWTRLFLWVPSIRAHERRRTENLLTEWGIRMGSLHDDDVNRALKAAIEDARQSHRKAKRRAECLDSSLRKYEEALAEITRWVSAHAADDRLSDRPPQDLSAVCDQVFRLKLFKLATHYWEARWLIELKEFVDNNDSDKKSERKLLRKLRRFAKLTPCFVSTFYMLPRTFMAYRLKNETWQDVPLFSEIDLLIVDEAGQANPETSAASFALAKKALVVGDTAQIEPVWGVPADVDRGNLELFGLLGSEEHYDDFWLRSGLMASNGNLMRIAQRQSHYQQLPKLERGLYLTEHRRCVKEIISYCNDLAYRGLLEPMRPPLDRPVPWGTLSMVPVWAPSRSYGSSRGNPDEAQAIVEWLKDQYEPIVAYCRSQNPNFYKLDDDEVFNRAIGIVTPFAQQARLIQSAIRNANLPMATVGTVHRFQGGERTLVLFSSVYGSNNQDDSKFYDRGKNMLNVAVSRAKDSFVVFGDPDVFGRGSSKSPSGLLRGRLKILGEDERSSHG